MREFNNPTNTKLSSIRLSRTKNPTYQHCKKTKLCQINLSLRNGAKKVCSHPTTASSPSLICNLRCSLASATLIVNPSSTTTASCAKPQEFLTCPLFSARLKPRDSAETCGRRFKPSSPDKHRLSARR